MSELNLKNVRAYLSGVLGTKYLCAAVDAAIRREAKLCEEVDEAKGHIEDLDIRLHAANRKIVKLEASGAQDMQWQPIKTAPKDETVLLHFPDMGKSSVVRGKWEDDRFSNNPKPYWTHDNIRIWGVRETRANPPTHWMPLPAAPVAKNIVKVSAKEDEYGQVA